MSTRGNVIFVSRFYMEENNLTEKNFRNIKSPKNRIIKNSYKIYVHSDMYPSGAMKDLQAFLRMPGAKRRASDTSYLSAWFVGWKCLDMVPYTRRMGDSDFKYEECTNPSLEDMKASKDFFGIGLLQEPSDWTSYSYLIVPRLEEARDAAEKGNRNYFRYTDLNSFDIYIYDGCFDKFLGKINSEDNITEYENEDWWY